MVWGRRFSVCSGRIMGEMGGMFRSAGIFAYKTPDRTHLERIWSGYFKVLDGCVVVPDGYRI